MKRITRLMLVLIFVAAMLPASGASAQAPLPPGDPNCILLGQTLAAQFPGYTYETGMIGAATYCIIIPPGWGTPVGRTDLILFAHGYVAPLTPQPIIPWNQLIITDPVSGSTVNLPAIITGLGYAFATTSYSKNGLAVQEGVADILALVNYFVSSHSPVGNVFLTGASEGGLVTTLAIERYPQVFSGGLATCGPIGDFQAQINYWSDFRTVFDYFFPRLLKSPPKPAEPSTTIYIPNSTIENWVLQDLKDKVSQALTENPLKTAQLFSVTKAAIDLADPAGSKLKTAQGILDYNIVSTDEGRMELYGYLTQPPPDLMGTNAGSPYSNQTRKYRGSLNDNLLNKKIDRYEADPAALMALEAYQTSGDLQRPLVVMHTTGDEIVPFWHTALYAKKAFAQNNLSQLTLIPILRYGHCAFTQGEAVTAFFAMVTKATLQEPVMMIPDLVLPDAKAKEDFNMLWKDYR